MNPPGTNDTETRHTAGASPYPEFRPAMREAVGFWEKGRIYYGIILLCVTIVRVIHFWPVSKVLYTDNLGGFLGGFLGAILIANFFYCFAYLLEGIILIPILRPFRHRIRWIVFILGTILASTFAVLLLDNELLRPPYID